MNTKNKYTTLAAPIVVIILAVILLLLGQETERAPQVTEEVGAVSTQQSDTFDIPSDLPIDGDIEESYTTGGNGSIVQVMVYHSASTVSAVAEMYTTYYQENGYTLLDSSQENGVLAFLGVSNGTQMTVVGYENGENTLVEVSLRRLGE
ncbi:MAG: hypothetical protein WD579_00380 [Candidatus Paceibacterota bacterium]